MRNRQNADGAVNRKPRARSAAKTFDSVPQSSPMSETAVMNALLPQAVQFIIFTQAAALVSQSPVAAQIPLAWLNDLKPSKNKSARDGLHLRWLTFEAMNKAGGGQQFDPRRSYVYRRQSADGSQVSYLVVLIATLHWRDRATDTELPLYAGQGLRLVATIGFTPLRLIAESVTLSLPPVPAANVEIWNSVLAWNDVTYLLDANSGDRWPDAAGLHPWEYATYSVGLRVGAASSAGGIQPTAYFLAQLNAYSPSASAPAKARDVPAYALEASVVSGGGASPNLYGLKRYPLFANLQKLAFRNDPATMRGWRTRSKARYPAYPDGRPNASWTVLDQFRVLCDLGMLPATSAGHHALADPKGRFFVAQSRHVEGGAASFDENQPVVIADATNYNSRSDGFAAINAYVRALEFFARLEFYGLPVSTHLAFLKQPLAVRYRAGIVPGAGDGRTVNAQVRWSPSAHPNTFPSSLEVRFALADLQSNEGRVSAVRRTGRVKRAPLSIGAARRWSWHEFGHVLIAGATGSLELDFAHSVGDGLGAILCDPQSVLAQETQRPAWRGVTFPWQSIPNRRHDHVAADGWSWSGVHARPSRFYAGIGGHHSLNRGGYCSEQLMSSSLFRLYRALGGDAESAPGVRDIGWRIIAAEHSVSLIMSAVGILGYSGASVVRTVEDFVDSFKPADKTMLPLSTTYQGVTHTRYAGMAHKVVRWAFEQQGAFPPAAATPWTHNAPGVAPPVDVFIASRRSGEKGGYAPVTFIDARHLADPNAMWVQRSKSGRVHAAPKGNAINYVYVVVGNRGQQTGLQTTVRVYRARLTRGRVPLWTAAAWSELPPDQAGDEGPTDVNAATSVTFGPFRWDDARPRRRYALLAVATCSADLANIDPAASLPCANSPCSVDELVAFDNNLGLLLVRAQ